MSLITRLAISRPYLNSLRISRRSLSILSVPPPQTEDGKLVYEGKITVQVKLVKGFSVTTSALGLALQPLVFKGLSTLPIVLQVMMGSGIGFFVLATPLLLHTITKRYVTHMYYDSEKDTFTATTLSLLLKEKQLTFKPDDVEVPEISGIFSHVKAKGKPLFIDISGVLDKAAYKRLLKYDQPIKF
ncbi:unnamed protein product [Dimorphilus gyrociliatus]|uniref:Uncharacterized protein n=1 Tax=Dimorphilus gyrociliatus TaxID=2664684 RepID=A0A7I8VLY1_9ANNE|nr:unnamed protein product [Dimorphilus gyrociliatus]